MLPSHHPSSWAGRDFKPRPSVQILNLYLVHSLTRVWLCNPMDCNLPGFALLHCPPEFALTHVRWVGDAIRPSHPLSPPSFPAFNPSQPQGLFQWVGSSYQVAKVLELQLQHQSFQWIFRVDFLQDWLVWSSHSPRDSQESSPTPQFKSTNSSALSLLYGPTLTSIHDDLVNRIKMITATIMAMLPLLVLWEVTGPGICSLCTHSTPLNFTFPNKKV